VRAPASLGGGAGVLRARCLTFAGVSRSSHTQFEWLHAPAPGEPHTKFEGTVVDGCVRAGLAVHALDHQSASCPAQQYAPF